MSITHEQKTEIGQTYLNEIARRIELRERAKKDLPPGVTDADKAAALTADLESRFPGITEVLGPVAKVTSDYGPQATLKSGLTLDLEQKVTMPGYKAVNAANDKLTAKRQALCKELGFLYGLKDGSMVGAFQYYIARLWSPTSKSETLPRSTFVTHFEAFADSKRGFTCAL